MVETVYFALLSLLQKPKIGLVNIYNNNFRIELRWYGTPCNIYNNERILKSDYNYGFKIDCQNW